jgi:hypothetical protein
MSTPCVRDLYAMCGLLRSSECACVDRRRRRRRLQDMEGGHALNRDLQQLAEATSGQVSSVVMEVLFPPSYPTEPFFLR